MTKRFWLSWEEHDSPGDSRPITDPPNSAILAWWESGFASDESYATMVALVRAKDERAAWAAVRKDWPTKRARVIRFCNEVDSDWRPSDRFPLRGWALKRVEAGRD